MNDFAINNLLSDVNAISQKYDLLAKETGGNFNVFKIADIVDKEVAMCRVLYELLSPKGSHNQGILYLSLFVKNVLVIDVDDQALYNAVVEREKVITNDRRIDLFIQFGGYSIPIEVKINAGEQKNQCDDYLKFAQAPDALPFMYYLTLDSSAPSKYSASQTDNIKNVSWATDILRWIETCIVQPQTIKLSPIREVLQQFASVVRMLTHQTERGEKMEILKIIAKTPENMRSAIEISKSTDECKREMLRKILLSIKQNFGKTDMLVESNYEDNIQKYYQQKASTCPRICWKLRDIDALHELRFRLEVNHRLYIGLDIFNKQTNSFDKNGAKGEWHYWEYLPSSGQTPCDDIPNFKDCNEGFFNLFEANDYDGFVDRCVQEMQGKWDEWSSLDLAAKK